MISKVEFEYTKTKIKKMEDQLFDFETQNPLYLSYDAYNRLPYEEQTKLKSEWDQYYRDVQGTSIWKLMLKSKEALKRGDIATVKQCAKEAGDYTTYLKKPRLEDPLYLGYKMSSYHVFKTKLAALKELYEEYLPVYGKKSEVNSL